MRPGSRCWRVTASGGSTARCTDLGRFGEELKDRGFLVRPLDLATVVDVPVNTHLALVSPPPRFRSSPARWSGYCDYVERGGNLLWPQTPVHSTDWSHWPIAGGRVSPTVVDSARPPSWTATRRGGGDHRLPRRCARRRAAQTRPTTGRRGLRDRGRPRLVGGQLPGHRRRQLERDRPHRGRYLPRRGGGGAAGSRWPWCSRSPAPSGRTSGSSGWW